jgi:hypothetical protein
MCLQRLPRPRTRHDWQRIEGGFYKVLRVSVVNHLRFALPCDSRHIKKEQHHFKSRVWYRRGAEVKTMVSKCANPKCKAPFLYLHEGRLVPVRLAESRIELFWLCADCAPRLSLKIAMDGIINVVPRRPEGVIQR